MQSKAATVQEYLAQLPPERRAVVAAVRALIRANLQEGFEEGMQYGMIGYFVPHRLYPGGYHCDPKQPLPFVGLASQKNHLAVYLMCLYSDAAETKRFREAWKRAGKKLDMGKSCLRFSRLEDLALDVLGDAIRRVTVAQYIRNYEAGLKGSRRQTAETAAPTPRKAKATSATKRPVRR